MQSFKSISSKTATGIPILSTGSQQWRKAGKQCGDSNLYRLPTMQQTSPMSWIENCSCFMPEGKPKNPKSIASKETFSTKELDSTLPPRQGAGINGTAKNPLLQDDDVESYESPLTNTVVLHVPYCTRCAVWIIAPKDFSSAY
ncbi:unnamed protein product [Clavelina lepadiformis]|uniref:Uncharacterized protein n=1 Tax=Clavelina lepadiformis TaxID=159417 RepID=A0ABP0FTU9_CLALP